MRFIKGGSLAPFTNTMPFKISRFVILFGHKFV